MDLDRTLIIGPVRNSQRLRIPPLPAETEVNIMPAAELIRELVAPTSEVIPSAQVLGPKSTFITKPRRPLDGSDRLARAIEEQNRLVEHAQWRSELQLLVSHAQKLGARPAPARPAADPLPPVSNGTSTIAQNLEAFRASAKLSYRGLATLIGCDHKAVTKHCRGKRVPEDRTLSEYASAFTRVLRRAVTVEELRGVGTNHN
jgi:hypothetical protein